MSMNEPLYFEVVEPTMFETKFKGTLQETVECKRCGQIFSYPTYNPYVFCPFCGARKDDNG